MREEVQHVLFAIAKRVFRDQADGDYIAARLSHRAGLREQALWSSLQAMEKYCKCILLYHEKPVLGFGHNLEMLYDAVRDLKAQFVARPPWLREFMTYLKRFGDNRYLTSDTYTMGDELLKLDDAAWSIRRYCQFFHWEVLENGQTIDLYDRLIADADSDERCSDPRRFLPHSDGVIEKVLGRNHSDYTRSALIWKNFYFGGGRNKSFLFRRTSTFETPPHLAPWAVQDPSIEQEVRRFVKL